MDELIDDVTPYTLVAKPRLRRLGEQVWWLAVDKHVEGAFVECGVWRGGASFLMARVLQEAGISDRRVWLLDSFEGMSPPQELDGERVLRRWADQDPAVNFQKLAVAEADVRDTARRLGVDAICEIRRGWFQESLTRLATEIGKIALLRIDCDFYEPVKLCLEGLYDSVTPGGLVVFDDYFGYPGCSIAVHQFLGTRREPYPLVALPDLWIAWLRKGELA